MISSVMSKTALKSVLSSAKKGVNYGANFIFGTGADIAGSEIRAAVNARKATGQSLTNAIKDGLKTGITKSNEQVAKTGFTASIKKAFSTLPKEIGNGWKSGGAAKTGVGKFFSKLGNAIKPLSKIMPFALNALMAASYIPSIMERTQDEGIWGGIKETIKSVGKLGLFALGSAVGAAGGFIGSMAGITAASFIGDAVFGKDYSAEKEEQLETMKAYSQLNVQQSQIDYSA